MSKIELSDNPFTIGIKMSDGNPGAATVCVELMKNNESIDPDAAMGQLNTILYMDTLGIYAERIWMLYKDVCKKDIVYMIAALRAIQLGMMPEERLNMAIDNYGEGMMGKEVLLKKIRERLPEFAKDIK